MVMPSLDFDDMVIKRDAGRFASLRSLVTGPVDLGFVAVFHVVFEVVDVEKAFPTRGVRDQYFGI